MRYGNRNLSRVMRMFGLAIRKRWTEVWVHEKSRLILIDRVAFHPSIIGFPVNTYIGNLKIGPGNTELWDPRISLDARSCVALYEL